MPNIPDLTCPQCGAAVPTRMAAGVSGVLVRFERCTIQCGACGFHVPLEGTFLSTSATFDRIISAEPTAAELEALIRVFTNAANISPDEAKAKVDEEVPRLTPFLTDYFGVEPAKWGEILAPLLLVLGFLLGMVRDPSFESFSKVAAAVVVAARAALKKEKAPVDLEAAAMRGAELALEAQERRRRERNKNKRERRNRR